MSATEFKNLGNQAFKEQKFDESIQFYSQALQLAPNDHILYSNRSGSYASLHKYQEALEDAKKCVQLNPGFVKGYQRKGLAQFYLDDFEEAVASYKEGLAIDPNNQALKDGLKSAEEKLSSDNDMGFDSFAGGAAGNPFGDLLNNPGIKRLLQILGQDPRTSKYVADKSFTTMLTLLMMNPGSAGQFVQNDPRLQLAYQVIMENPEAQKIFFQDVMSRFKPTAGEQAPPQQHQPQAEQPQQQQQQQQQQPPQQTHHQPPPQSRKMEEEKPIEESEKAKLEGNEHYKRKEFQQALSAYDRAIAIKQEPLYYNNKAAVYIELKQFDEAINAVETALQVMADHHSNDFGKKAKLFARKAKVLWLQGKLEEAIDFYQKSLLEDQVQSVKEELRKVQKEKADRDHQAYINPQIAEEHNTKGGEFFKSGSFPAALKEYEEAIKRSPKDPKYWCNRATTYMKLMEFPAALRDLERCMELDPKYVKAYVKKGQCHLVMKDFKRAKDTYDAGLAIDPTNQEMIQGQEKVRMGIYSSNSGETEEQQKQRASRAASDPEIQQIMREPEVINLLQEMQANPQTAVQAMMKNKDLAGKIEKLIAAGILKVG